ncbi:MAG: hypothetical protein DHS20C18_31970 [Saprospiraceae bacterium]|nr:MAG: hypothetical protein DHS20C18_31970 [Saprospiraceae bacterium]
MSIKKLTAEAHYYDETEWPFSSAFVWEKVLKKEENTFNLFQCADQLRLSGNYERAHELLSQIELDDLSQDYKYYYFMSLGKLYEDQFNIDAAIKAYQECITYEFDSTLPYVFLANLLSRQGQLAEAENILTQAVNKEGDLDEVYYHLSTTCARQRKLADAITAMKKCLDINESYPNAQALLEDFKNLKKLKSK